MFLLFFFVMATLFPTSKICAGATVIWDGLGDGDGEHPLSGYFEWIWACEVSIYALQAANALGWVPPDPVEITTKMSV